MITKVEMSTKWDGQPQKRENRATLSYAGRLTFGSKIEDDLEQRGWKGGGKGRMAIDMVSIIDGIITPGRIIAERRLIIEAELLPITIIHHN